MLYKYSEQKSIIELDLKKGSYRFELWGAQGGHGCTDTDKLTKFYGGRGSYVQGKVNFPHAQTIYLYIGGKGFDPPSCTTNVIGRGGFNGGSDSGCDTRDDDQPGGGGCATDIRLINDTSNKSLYSRIIVAAGGSGSSWYTFGAPGGDLTDYKTAALESKSFLKSDTNQTNGYSLGKGENGKNSIRVPTSGAGGGYYGGFSGTLLTDQENSDYFYKTVSSSGSSYISGYLGCNSINEKGIHTNSPNHYSGIIFYDSKMLNGDQLFFSPDNVIEEGHIGNGAIQISKLSVCTCNQMFFFRFNLLLDFIGLFILNTE